MDLPKSKEDFDKLATICKNVHQETNHLNINRDWTQADIDLFVSQFNDSQEEDNLVDMSKLDPNFLPLEYFQKKFSGFDDEIIQVLYECENKKLEDSRIAPLRIKNEKLKLSDNLSTSTYIDDKAETEAEGHAETSGDADSEGSDTTGDDKEKEEAEEEDKDNTASV